MGKEIGDDPELLATLFVAQFANMIPEPEARPASTRVRPSLFRQRVQRAVPATATGAGAGDAAGTPAAGAAAAGSNNTPEGMLTRALQAMMGPQQAELVPSARSGAFPGQAGQGPCSRRRAVQRLLLLLGARRLL